MKYPFSKKMFTLASLLLLLLVSIGGAAAQDTVTLEWWTTAGRDSPEPAIRNLIAAFEAEHPNIKIDVSILAEGAYNDLMNTVFAAGEGVPDLAWYWSNNWLPQALDITDRLDNDPDISRDVFHTEYFNNWVVWNDRVIALPYDIGANFIMYNKDVFDDEGVEYPAEDWTPQDYLEIANSLRNEDKRRWGGDRPRGPFRALWRNMGAVNPYSDDSTTVEGNINSPESVAAYTWLWDLVDSDATPTPADLEVLGTEGTGPVDLFIAGRLGMATLNPGSMVSTLEAGVNFGVVPEPRVPGNENWVHGWALRAGIWKNSEHPDEAWEFLKYWIGPPGQRIMMEQGRGHFPPIPSVLAEYEHADTEWFQGFVNVLDATQTASWRKDHPCWRGAVIRGVSDAWDLIHLGEIERDEVQATLDAMVEPGQAALDECVPRLGG